MRLLAQSFAFIAFVFSYTKDRFPTLAMAQFKIYRSLINVTSTLTQIYHFMANLATEDDPFQNSKLCYEL